MYDRNSWQTSKIEHTQMEKTSVSYPQRSRILTQQEEPEPEEQEKTDLYEQKPSRFPCM